MSTDFFTLPAELREEVYRWLLPETIAFRPISTNDPVVAASQIPLQRRREPHGSLLFTSQEIRAEAEGRVWNHSFFIVNALWAGRMSSTQRTPFMDLAQWVGTSNLALVSQLEIVWDDRTLYTRVVRPARTRASRLIEDESDRRMDLAVMRLNMTVRGTIRYLRGVRRLRIGGHMRNMFDLHSHTAQTRWLQQLIVAIRRLAYGLPDLQVFEIDEDLFCWQDGQSAAQEFLRLLTRLRAARPDMAARRVWARASRGYYERRVRPIPL